MKVLHLISGGDTGGAKTHVFALLDALKNMAEVKIVCLMPGAFFDEIRERGVEAVLIEQKSRFDLSVVSELAKLITEEKFQVVHAHGARANFIASFLKKRVHVPVVTTVHSDYRLDFDGLYRKLVYTGLNILSLRKMDYYIAVSSSFRNMLISRNFRPNQIFTVYNGMDYSGQMVFEEKEAFAKRVGVPYDPSFTYVGLIGRHDFVKGHDVFIRAAALSAEKDPSLRFLIAGDGEGREELLRLAEEVGIADKLYFIGFIKDIYSFINFIDMNTLSSRSESFPYVLLEGARMKKPTISAAVGGIPDLIRDGETGLLFPSEDYKAFAEKILMLAQDKEKQEMYGEALYRLATENFSNENLARTHMGIYKAILRDFASKKEYDVALSGYYGFHNSGDDALLEAILKSLKAKKPEIRPIVFSARPKETMRQYGVDAVHRFSPVSLSRYLGKTHILINGGGSLLQDKTSSKSLWYYLYVMHLARKKGAAVYVYANGIGPLHGANCKRAARALEAAAQITLRDEASLREIEALGIQNQNVKLTADPALSLPAVSKETARAILEKEGAGAEKAYLAVSVRDWNESDRNFCRKLAFCIDYAAEKYGMVPLFIPMKKKADAFFAQKLSGEMKTKLYSLSENHTVSEIMGVVRECTALIGMRLHALIYAAGGGVPVIGLSYDPKVRGFMEYIGQDRICDIREIETEAVCRFMDEICTAGDEIRTALSQKAEALLKKAEENADICISLLSEIEKL
ncbi:MAG: polysaccharide pyruvyl transferase CsaB [Clostridia bacterium]|nr:polysaccharide pyruvyl transferase CsaB [Clostridia bacterium]